MTELFPLLSGFVLGVIPGRRALSPLALAMATLVLGIGAAFASGELRVNWAFALVDIALVGASAVAGAWAARRLARAGSRYNASARKARSAG